MLDNRAVRLVLAVLLAVGFGVLLPGMSWLGRLFVAAVLLAVVRVAAL